MPRATNNLTADMFGQQKNYPVPPMESGYLAWKKQNEKPKEINMASFTEFPDLAANPQTTKQAKSGVFANVSLVDKLKQTIAAEEEEIKRRRLEDHDKEERWLRKNCVALPCKGLKPSERDPDSAPVYHFKEDVYVPMPLFQIKTKEEYDFIRKVAVLDYIGAPVPQEIIPQQTVELPEYFIEEESIDVDENNNIVS